MYICCGKLCWGADEEFAGPYKGDPPHDIMLSEAEEEDLGDYINEKLQILDAVDCLLQGWQTRAQRNSPESMHRLEYAQAGAAVVRQRYQSYLDGEEEEGEGEEEEDEEQDTARNFKTLRLRIVESRLRNMKFCDSSSDAARRGFVQEIDRVFADLNSSMEQYEQDKVVMSADERVPALKSCYEEISTELRAIYVTIRRRVVLDCDDMWDDVPEHTLKQFPDIPDSEDSDPRGAWCESILETAIFTGYSGPAASSSTQIRKQTSIPAEPRSSKHSAGKFGQRPCRNAEHEAEHVGPPNKILYCLPL